MKEGEEVKEVEQDKETKAAVKRGTNAPQARPSGQLYAPHQIHGYYSLPLSVYQPAQSYVDHARQPDPLPIKRRNQGGVASSELFPIKLHKMLETVEAEGKTDVVSFRPHGRAFTIHKPRRFTAEIMPRYAMLDATR